MQKTVLKIQGMHCVSCEKIIEMELKEVAGVESAKVNYKAGEAIVEVKSETDRNAVLAAVKKAGYEAQIIREEPDDQSPDDQNNGMDIEKKP